MSINTLANAAAARRPDIGVPNDMPHGHLETAAAAGNAPSQAPAKPQEATKADTALHVLTAYVPTEILTLYVAVLAVQPATTGGAAAAVWGVNMTPQMITFLAFLVASPLVVWMVFAAKLKAAGKPLPSHYSTWPVWEMFAATIAYAAWAFALPNSPLQSTYSAGLAGIAVLLASTALGLIAPLVQRPLATGEAAPDPQPDKPAQPTVVP